MGDTSRTHLRLYRRGSHSHCSEPLSSTYRYQANTLRSGPKAGIYYVRATWCPTNGRATAGYSLAIAWGCASAREVVLDTIKTTRALGIWPGGWRLEHIRGSLRGGWRWLEGRVLPPPLAASTKFSSLWHHRVKAVHTKRWVAAPAFG